MNAPGGQEKGAPVIGIAACVVGVIGAGAGAYCNASIMPRYHAASEDHLQSILKGDRNNDAAFEAWADAKDEATPFGFVAFGFGGLALVLAIVGLVKKQMAPSAVAMLLAIGSIIAGVLIVPAM